MASGYHLYAETTQHAAPALLALRAEQHLLCAVHMPSTATTADACPVRDRLQVWTAACWQPCMARVHARSHVSCSTSQAVTCCWSRPDGRRGALSSSTSRPPRGGRLDWRLRGGTVGQLSEGPHMVQASQGLWGCVALLLLASRCGVQGLLVTGCPGKQTSEGVLAGPGGSAAVDRGPGLGHSGCRRLPVGVAVERAPSMASSACHMATRVRGPSSAAVSLALAIFSRQTNSDLYVSGRSVLHRLTAGALSQRTMRKTVFIREWGSVPSLAVKVQQRQH